METTKSVTELFDEAATTDATETFDRLWGTMSRLADRIHDRFDLAADPSVADLEHFGEEGGPQGSLKAWAGDGVDWLINSWLGDKAAGFTNMHLTCWMGPETRVPHLGMAWGTLPHLWFFVDLLPRADLFCDLDYVDRYYEPANDAFMELKNDPEASAFVSQDTFTRVGVGPSAFCTVLPNTIERIESIERYATKRVDQWMTYVDEAEPTPEADREALALRDLTMRRNIAQRDPANVLAERFYGKDLTTRLVGSLWGEHREIPRLEK